MDALREYVQQVILKKVRLEIAILFGFLWLLILNFIVYNYDIGVHYLGFLNLYFEAHVLNEYIVLIFYIRFLTLLFLFSTHFLIVYYRKVFQASTDEYGYEAMQRFRRIRMLNQFYSYKPLNEEQIVKLNKIERDKITVGEWLGNGNFGEVFQGHLKNGNKMGPPVALKSLRREAKNDKNAFLEEAYVLSCFDHKNIVHYYGICLSTDEDYIIMELMEGGDLLKYLREYRALKDTDQALSVIDLLRICMDVAAGCKYLEELKFVHRDLACRNCLVTLKNPESRRIKISDFGLARKIHQSDYYRLKRGKFILPVRWMAPESLTDGIFDSKSDVWSFGVLCWEVMTLGSEPFEEKNVGEVLKHVKKGGKLEKPESCSDQIFETLDSCWAFDPKDRHSFSRCLDQLEIQLNKLVKAGNNPKIILGKEKEVNDEKDEKDKRRSMTQKARTSSRSSSSHYPKLLFKETDAEKLEQNLKDLSNLGRRLIYGNRDSVVKRSTKKSLETEFNS